MTSPGYDVLMVVHAFCALIGFGALATTGAYAQAVRRAREPFSNETLKRFFKPGHNLASATMLAVPLLGAGLLVANHGQDLHLAYPWIGIACWIVAVGVATSVIWPAERQLQVLLARGVESAEAAVPLSREALDSLATRCLRGSAVTTLCFVVAFVVMVWQP